MKTNYNYQATLAEKLANPAPRSMLINPHASAREQDRQRRRLNNWYYQQSLRSAVVGR